MGSEPVFFNIGVTPLVSDEWMMAETRGRRDRRQDLTRAVGRGSG